MIQRKVEDRVLDLLVLVSEFKELDIPEVKFDLNGSCAGMCCKRGDSYTLRFNLKLLEENRKDFLRFTVPHEVAHYVVSMFFGKVKPHGEQWKTIMQFFGVENPLRCHNYKIQNLGLWKYKCDCQEHYLGSLRHARVARGSHYRCNICKGRLEFIGENT